MKVLCYIILLYEHQLVDKGFSFGHISQYYILGSMIYTLLPQQLSGGFERQPKSS